MPMEQLGATIARSMPSRSMSASRASTSWSPGRIGPDGSPGRSSVHASPSIRSRGEAVRAWTYRVSRPGRSTGDHDVEARSTAGRRWPTSRSSRRALGGHRVLPPGESAERCRNEGVLELADGCRPGPGTARGTRPSLDAVLVRGLVGFALPAGALGRAQGGELRPLLELLAPREPAPSLVHPGPAPWRCRPGRPPATSRCGGPHSRPTSPTCRRARLPGLGPRPAPRRLLRDAGGMPAARGALVAARRTPGAAWPKHVTSRPRYRPRAVDAIIRALGVDHLLNGSDRPYAEPADLGLGPAVDAALRPTNPPRRPPDVHA